jgi:hypothetical protein
LDWNQRSISAGICILTIQQNKHPEVYLSLERLAHLYKIKSKYLLNKDDKKQSDKLRSQSIAYLKQALKTMNSNFPTNSEHFARIEAKLKSL